jgi:hypothetical protein
MMGIPCEGPAYIHGDNQFVLSSCGIPDSILTKKSQSIAYHLYVKVLPGMSGGLRMSTLTIMKLTY